MQTYTGLEYLKIDIANQFGGSLDKEQFETRIAWVDENDAYLEELIHSADQKHQPQYLAAVMAYRDTQNGLPTGHLVGLDACASGPSLMACLTGCVVTAKNTGLIGKKRMDLYTVCTDAMSNILGSVVEIDRKLVKKAQMPFFYGSKARPKEIFVDGSDEYHAFHEANEEVAPGACKLLYVLLASWQDYALSHTWVLPDGFEVYCPTMVSVIETVENSELDGAKVNYIHDVNKGIERGEKGSLAVAANAIHSCDGFVVREMTRRCNYDINELNSSIKLIKDELNRRLDEST